MNKNNRSENILGFPITTMSKAECISTVRPWLDNGVARRYFVCANPHSLEVARADTLFARALREADLLVPDGVGIVMASKMLGGSIKERVTGSDIFMGLSSLLNHDASGKHRYFFLGSAEGTLEKIRQKMAADFPNIVICGTYSPPFRDEFSEEENQLMAEAVNNAKPDVLWVSMTAPKQEKWIHRNRHRLNVAFIGAIGAVFDFYTGNVRRSHPFFQKLGLEWLPRLLREPRRLWRRNFISNPSFLFRILHSRFFNRKRR